MSETKEDQQRTFPSLMAEPSVFCRYVPHSRSMPAPNTAAHYTNRVENETNINGTEETTEVTRGGGNRPTHSGVSSGGVLMIINHRVYSATVRSDITLEALQR